MVFLNQFMGDPAHIEAFFKGSVVVSETAVEAAHGSPFWVKSAAFVAMLLGFGAAWQMYIRDTAMPKRLADANPGLYQFLLNKWYFDELYDFLFVRPALWLGRALWLGFDDWLIDKTIVEGLGNRIRDVTTQVVKLQSGYLYHYAFVMLIGIAALLTWAIAAGGLLG
jgi:NADH-quinone oxidoreductase subunit L